MFFTGHAELTIDSKQRLAIPAKYRSQWNEARDGAAWFCIPWPGGILRLYTETRFQSMAEQVAQTLTPDQDQADLEADLFSLAERLEMDAAGRITIPRSHLELTGLAGEVVVVGASNRLEVRDRGLWLASTKDRFNRLPSLAARLDARNARHRPD